MLEKKINNKIEKKLTASQIVMIRNKSILLMYRRMTMVVLFQLFVFILILLTLGIFIGKDNPPRYVPLTSEGQIIPYIDSSLPNKDDGAIIKFSLDAIRHINQYDYVNYKNQFSDMQKYFTSSGWVSYLDGYEKSNIINLLKNNKAVVSSELVGNPKVVVSGFSKTFNSFMWKVDIPIKINYYESTKERQGVNSQLGVISLTIIRVPVTENADGVGILRYVFDSSNKAQEKIQQN